MLVSYAEFPQALNVSRTPNLFLHLHFKKCFHRQVLQVQERRKAKLTLMGIYGGQ